MPDTRPVRERSARVRTAATKGDWVRFLGTWVRHPGAMGAIASSSPRYCDEMVRQSTTDLPGPILELGAGLGVVTQALLRAGIEPSRITSIEYDGKFAAALRQRFPAVDIIEGDGLDLRGTLSHRAGERFASILFAIPIVRFPQARRRALLDHYFERILPGGNLTQLSYSFVPPIRPDLDRYTVSSSPVVWSNLPPARVWVYRRADETAGRTRTRPDLRRAGRR